MRKVIIIEDDKLTLKLLDFKFSKLGFEVVQCYDGSSLEEKISPDIPYAVLDVNLPDLLAERAINVLHAVNPNIMIFGTSATAEEDIDPNLRIKFAYFLQKPYNSTGFKAFTEFLMTLDD